MAEEGIGAVVQPLQEANQGTTLALDALGEKLDTNTEITKDVQPLQEANQGTTLALDALGKKLDTNTEITEESSEDVTALKGEVSQSNVKLETSAPTLEELEANLYKLTHPDEKGDKKDEKDDKKDESASWLERIFFLEKFGQKGTRKERARLREKEREDARKKKGGMMRRMMIGDKGASKKGGIFGALKSIGGGIMNIFSGKGFVFKILAKLFKVLKFIVGGVALLAVGAFLMADPATQEKIINGVMNFFVKVGEFLTMLGDAFAKGFMSNLDDAEDGTEGLKTKFTKFQEAWGKAFKAINEMKFSVMGKSYKGLAGAAELMGDVFGKIAGWFLDVGTGIANLISDPRKVWMGMKISISNFFGGLGDMLGRMIDDFFNMEFFISLLPRWLVEALGAGGFIKQFSEERAMEKYTEMGKLATREKELIARHDQFQQEYDEADTKKKGLEAKLEKERGGLTEAEIKTREEEIEVEEVKRIRSYELVEESKAEVERNKDQFDHAKKAFDKSNEVAIKERANDLIRTQTGTNVAAVEEEIAADLEEAADRRKAGINAGGRSLDGSIADMDRFAKLIEESTGESVEFSKQGALKSGIITDKFLRSEEGQKMKNEMFKIFGQQENRFTESYITEFLQLGQQKKGEIKHFTDKANKKRKDLADKTAALLPAAMKQAEDEKLSEYGSAHYLKVSGKIPDKIKKKPEAPAGSEKVSTDKSSGDKKPKLLPESPEQPVIKALPAGSFHMIEGQEEGAVGWVKVGERMKYYYSEEAREQLLQGLIPAAGMAKGGVVGMSPFADLSIGKALGLESGGLFTLSQGEFVLDNQAAQTFLSAAMILKGQDLSGQSLMNLQREQSAGLAEQGQAVASVNVMNNSTQQVTQSSGVVFPTPAIEPQNFELRQVSALVA